ncbi:folate family ECF transporter S component [Lactobacillus delbrueckii subsp. bulgaricus]|uniref:folate family ECF transporter S component n=3 Tax=Lactobacillus delbrueckii TaxID=1584 RepID=UPI001E5D9F72|nr:folate family ECF transporter S component [Lactobacillus delbrueckii]MCD5462038.1 folate family ECF transporter S component [Lactobacillus delbrueckii subsp. bulgaricus]MCD5477437.1 folate family ECF transporter S component [Lactobacillus delbrueckii subsp. bulgaricus]UUY35324.1 folate family ECF transporter S component [Lactobacillus delbrueckii subsp. bulgaricus]
MKSESKVSSKLELRELVLLAMVIAIKVVLGQFKVGDATLQVGLGFIGSVMLGYLFGPWWGFAGGALSDLVSSAIFGNLGGFFIGFTLTAALESMIYGFFLYKKPIQIWRVIASVICVTVICYIGLNTLWVSMLGGTNFMVALSSRILKEIITPWIHMVVVWFILEGLSRVKLSRKF